MQLCRRKSRCVKAVSNKAVLRSAEHREQQPHSSTSGSVGRENPCLQEAAMMGASPGGAQAFPVTLLECQAGDNLPAQRQRWSQKTKDLGWGMDTAIH